MTTCCSCRSARGSLPICVGKYITDRLAGRDDIEDGLVFISSCQPKPGCMDAVKAGLKKYGSFAECYETDIGTTIVGTARKKLNSDAAAREQPIRMPPRIVAPERLVPGTSEST